LFSPDGSSKFQLREDIALAEDLDFLAVHLDVRARVLAVQDRVANLHSDRRTVAVVIGFAGTDRDDFAHLRLLLGGVG